MSAGRTRRLSRRYAPLGTPYGLPLPAGFVSESRVLTGRSPLKAAAGRERHLSLFSVAGQLTITRIGDSRNFSEGVLTRNRDPSGVTS
jgi:hypothetical protein